MKTVKLNNGWTVMAKETKYGMCAISYSNRTQASRKAFMLRASEGLDCDVMNGAGRPFYIRVNSLEIK